MSRNAVPSPALAGELRPDGRACCAVGGDRNWSARGQGQLLKARSGATQFIVMPVIQKRAIHH